MVTSRVLVLSDSHLSLRTPEAEANWAAIAAVAEGFDLVVHAGDLTLDGTEHPEDLVHAKSFLEALSVPWAAVPGNHDLGDNPGPADGPAVTSDRISRWCSTIGQDHWSLHLEPWTIIGINAQLLGSGLDEERKQWAWLEECLRTGGSAKPVLLISHKPVNATDDELVVAPAVRFVPEPARSRLEGLLRAVHCPVVLSGHVHQFRILDHGGRLHVWAPTTWAVLPEELQSTVGEKRGGALSLELGSDGEVAIAFVETPAFRQLMLGREIPSPYA